MDLQEIRKMKAEVEQSVTSMLYEFEKVTGVKVKEVLCHSIEEIEDITLKCEI